MENYNEYSSFKKKELHCHLSGSIPYQTTLELCEKYKIEIPKDFNYPNDLLIKHRVDELGDYFKPWKLLKKFPVDKACFAKIIDVVLGSFIEDNIDYVEFRYSPLTILKNNKHLTLKEALVWIVETFENYTKKSLINPKVILSIGREDYDYNFCKDLLQNLKEIGDNNTIVGVDLVGNENISVEKKAALFFKEAKHNLGLGISIHAGETGCVDNILWAINECDADRIGHALAIVDSEEAMIKVIEKDICIEVCLQSNYLTGNIETLESHPIHIFIKKNIPFVLSSDNPGLHDFTLSDEYKLFKRVTGRDDILKDMYDTQSKYLFGR